MYDFGPLKVHNCSVEVFNKLLKVNPEADMRAIPNQWLLEARALNQSLSDRLAELEAAAGAVDSATQEARKRYGQVITFELACKLDALAAALQEGK